MAERLRRRWALGLVAVILVPGPAAAACVSNAIRFDLAQNRSYNSALTVTGGGCVRSFTGGLRVTYESITVTERPRHMRIQPHSNGFGYRIAVLGGYKGRDRYAIRACGSSPTGRGCATIRYDVTIR